MEFFRFQYNSQLKEDVVTFGDYNNFPLIIPLCKHLVKRLLKIILTTHFKSYNKS